MSTPDTISSRGSNSATGSQSGQRRAILARTISMPTSPSVVISTFIAEQSELEDPVFKSPVEEMSPSPSIGKLVRFTHRGSCCFEECLLKTHEASIRKASIPEEPEKEAQVSWPPDVQVGGRHPNGLNRLNGVQRRGNHKHCQCWSQRCDRTF